MRSQGRPTPAKPSAFPPRRDVVSALRQRYGDEEPASSPAPAAAAAASPVKAPPPVKLNLSLPSQTKTPMKKSDIARSFSSPSLADSDPTRTSRARSFSDEVIENTAVLLTTLSLASVNSLEEASERILSPHPIVSPYRPRSFSTLRSGSVGSGGPWLNRAANTSFSGSTPASPRSGRSSSRVEEQAAADELSSQAPTEMRKELSGLAELSEPADPNAVYESAVELEEMADLEAPPEQAAHRWAAIASSSWMVRGADYLANKRKVPSATGSQMLACEIFRSETVVTNAAGRIGAPTATLHLRSTVPLERIFVVNLMLPAKGGSLHVVLYFGVHAPPAGEEVPPAVRLLRRFAEETDAWRSQRFKLIARVEKGPWLVRKAVPATPAVTGKTVPQEYTVGPNYVEVDMNITKSAAAGRVLGITRPVTEKLVVDMCFVLEGQAADELPEMVVGCGRLSHLDLGDASIPIL